MKILFKIQPCMLEYFMYSRDHKPGGKANGAFLLTSNFVKMLSDNEKLSRYKKRVANLKDQLICVFSQYEKAKRDLKVLDEMHEQSKRDLEKLYQDEIKHQKEMNDILKDLIRYYQKDSNVSNEETTIPVLKNENHAPAIDILSFRLEPTFLSFEHKKAVYLKNT